MICADHVNSNTGRDMSFGRVCTICNKVFRDVDAVSEHRLWEHPFNGGQPYNRDSLLHGTTLGRTIEGRDVLSSTTGCTESWVVAEGEPEISLSDASQGSGRGCEIEPRGHGQGMSNQDRRAGGNETLGRRRWTETGAAAEQNTPASAGTSIFISEVAEQPFLPDYETAVAGVPGCQDQRGPPPDYWAVMRGRQRGRRQQGRRYVNSLRRGRGLQGQPHQSLGSVAISRGEEYRLEQLLDLNNPNVVLRPGRPTNRTQVVGTRDDLLRIIFPGLSDVHQTRVYACQRSELRCVMPEENRTVHTAHESFYLESPDVLEGLLRDNGTNEFWVPAECWVITTIRAIRLWYAGRR